MRVGLDQACAALQQPEADPNGEHVTLSDQDHALLESLAEDGRVGCRTLASVTG
ncbi:hypothetical protein O1L44_29260 [Streptomyces noursei]|uniref:hypothetical protein n=1 Tax=Streptomyces noursei TaxID=1971 RepID=UPI00081CFCAB|nr:hypothetical protein SNOUR_33290 [Streptomyces noursei ATCC 11455]MCZ0996265.1 hypothetical protein [Streptomyces noursei]